MGGGADQMIGAGHEALLLSDAPRRFALAAAGAILHRAERMKHGEMGALPGVGKFDGGEAGEPVVRMDQVIGRAAARDHAAHGGGELRHESIDRLAIEGSRRTGRHVEDGDVVRAADLLRGVGVVAAGEDIDLIAEVSELAGEFADVDVHPARLGRARLGQGGGVGANEGQAMQLVRHRAA